MALPFVIPEVSNPAISPGEQRSDALVAFLALSEFVAVPKTIVSGGSFETLPLYCQGFNQFQGIINAVVGSNLKIEYGICNPLFPFNVLGYRTLFASVATAPSMIATFGALGSSVPAFNGDLFTLFTVRLSALGSNATINEMVLWFGSR